jgi:hypothetical protein
LVYTDNAFETEIMKAFPYTIAKEN